MRTAKILFRVTSVLVLLASLLPVSAASASTARPVNGATCVVDLSVVSSDGKRLVLAETDVMVPDVGLAGKEGFEGFVTERVIVTVLPNGSRQANLHEQAIFDGLVWEAGNPQPWRGQLALVLVGSGGPSDNRGTLRTTDSTVHFVGAWTTTPESNAKCESLGYPMGGSTVTGELHITPAR